MKLGKRIQRLRRERQMSQRELADKAGISQGYLSQLEAGEVKVPGFKTVMGLSESLNVSYYDLMGEAEPAEPEILPSLAQRLGRMTLGKQKRVEELLAELVV